MKKTPSRVLTPEQLEECARLKEIFDERQEASQGAGKRLSQVDVGILCGWSSPQSTMSQLLTGKLALSLESLVRLAHVLKFDPKRVSTRLSSSLQIIARLIDGGLINPEADVEEFRLPVTTGSVPVLFRAKVTREGRYSQGGAPSGCHGLLNIYSPDSEAYAVMIIGNSLLPRYRSHEFLIVQPGTDAQPGDDVLVNLNNGETLIKEFMYHRDGQYRLDSLIPGVEPIFLEESMVHSLHYVDAVVKKTRFEPS